MGKSTGYFKRGFFILFSLITCQNATLGQTSSTYVPNILPPSPNAAALMKFADVPVSNYTGTADISIPIYTIKAKGLTLPVNLAYHTGGIRLREEASSFGLGWTLNCGGAISRTIMDKDDFNASDYFTGNVPQIPGDISSIQYTQDYGAAPLTPYIIDFWCNYKVNLNSGTEDFYNAFVTTPFPYDMEPDIYSYNFAGKTGKFIITRSGNVILQKQDNIKIKFESSGNSFTVTDEDGNVYYFADKEYGTSAAFNSGPISTWNISKITTAQNDSIKFTYLTGPTIYLAPDQYEIYNAYCRSGAGYSTGNNSGISYSNTTIKTIDFSDGQLQFIYDANRTDLQNAPKLDTIKLFSKSASGLTYVKENDLYYSYFNNDPTGNANPLEFLRLRLDSVKESSNGISTAPYSFQYQLPLNEGYTKKHSYSVDHWGYYNGKGNTTFLPTTSTLFNPPNGSYFPYSNFTYSGADREPDPLYTSAFMLNQINYPTGGKTVLQFEENNYDQQKSVTGPQDFPYSQLTTIDTMLQISTWGTSSGSINLSNIVPVNLTGGTTQNLTMIVNFRAANSTGLTALHSGAYDRINFTFNNSSYDITNSANNCSGSVCSITVPIALVGSNNILGWSSYIDASVSHTDFTEIDVTFQFQKVQAVNNQQVNNDFRIAGGGMRIKSITDYSNSSTIAKERVYQYEYSVTNNGVNSIYSYGRAMSLPSYARYNPIPAAGTGATDEALTLFGNSNCSLTSVVSGNIIGYDQVTEKVINPLNNADDGETITIYHNIADSTFNYAGFRLPGVMNMGDNLNGSLLSKTYFQDLNGIYYPVSKDSNIYSTTNRIVYFTPKGVSTGSTVNVTSPNSCSYTQVAQKEVYVCLYPSIKSEKVLLNKSINYLYDQTGNYLKTTKNYFYDNPVHYQITREQQTDSKNNSHVSLIKYPQDYIPSGSSQTGNAILDTLIGKNMLSTVIEKTDSLYQSGSSTGTVTGSSLSLWRQLPVTHTMALDKQYELNIAAPITDFQPFHVTNNVTTQDSRYRQMISMDSYDNSNNISQYTATDQLANSFIWDYLNNYPIAKVTNASIDQIAYSSFEADGKGNWTFSGTPVPDPTSPTGSNCYLLTTGNITKSGLTTTKSYVFSFWQKAGASVTLTGGSYTSTKGKTINGWTYYEDIVTGASAITVSGTGYIDELRLYPSNAQMVSYTYAPLLGITSSCDADNKISYYFYDHLGRLKWIKDQDGNIIKTIQYHFTGVNGAQF